MPLPGPSGTRRTRPRRGVAGVLPGQDDLAGAQGDSTSSINFIPRPEHDPAGRQPDITLARYHLGREPQVSVEDALKRTIAWVQNHMTIEQVGHLHGASTMTRSLASPDSARQPPARRSESKPH